MLNKRILVLMFLLVFLPLVGCLPSPALPNQAPIITSDPITTATVGEAYTYDVEATDPDGDTVTYSLATPAGMTINSATGLIEWTPTAKGDYDVVVKVSDGALDITQSFIIVVSKPWAPPAPPTKTYTITASAGPGGSISPSGDVTVKKGKDKSFTITPDSVFYSIADVLVDGNSVGAVALYTFNDVTADHTIEATFAIDTYTITATAGANGAIDPSGAVVVNHGSNQTFTITPDSVFYGIDDVLVDGIYSMGPVSSYSFTNVTADHTIHATFILLGRVYNQTQNTYWGTIQSAEDNGTSGDTVLVSSWTYPENVIINVPGMTFQSYIKHGAVIEGTVEITVDNVTVDGFSIKDFSCIPCPDWSGIYMPNGTGILVINNLIDGTGTNPTKSIGIHTLFGGTAEATLESNIVRNCNMGIYSQGDSLLINDNTIEDTAHCGIGVDTVLGTIITGNTIRNSGNMGIEVFHANVVANFNNITGNTNFGVWTAGAQVDATNNWWGDASGPSGVGPGTGDAININVVYVPWSTSPY